MISESQLKDQLKIIADNKYKVLNNISLKTILDEMLFYIGSPDSELRDDLIYATFCKWILNDVLNKNEIVSILDTCLDNTHLKYKIDNGFEDDVFTRSFSVLVIALILEYDCKVSILDEKYVKHVYRELCSYYTLERNLVGYYQQKGWAHTVAHTADAFSILVTNKYIQEKEIITILGLVKSKFQNYVYSFIDGEDERTACIVENSKKEKKISIEKIIKWLNQLTFYTKRFELPGDTIIKGNIRNLLRSIYFKMDKNDDTIRVEIEKILKDVAFS